VTYYLLLVALGLLAGTMNAIAGGGSFVTFPVLVYLGLPPIAANATSTVALFPGTMASAWAYRSGLAGVAGVRLPLLLAISLIGGLLGAILLLITPGAAFDAVIPWLLLLATLTFAGGRQLAEAMARHFRIGRAPFLVLQFAISLYGGYFGGAVGLMMLAVWSLLDGAELKSMAPARTLLVSAANGMAVLCFIVAGAVRWTELAPMMAAAIAGGYAGARAARLVPAPVIRAFVILLSATITVVFFLRLR
jgi:uncharacterized membrane protein YfcA